MQFVCRPQWEMLLEVSNRNMYPGLLFPPRGAAPSPVTWGKFPQGFLKSAPDIPFFLKATCKDVWERGRESFYITVHILSSDELIEYIGSCWELEKPIDVRFGAGIFHFTDEAQWWTREEELTGRGNRGAGSNLLYRTFQFAWCQPGGGQKEEPDSSAKQESRGTTNSFN